MQAFGYPHLSTVCYIALFTNVKNGSGLKKRIIAASTAEGEEGDRERDAVNFAFIDAKPITSLEHLQSGIYGALVAQSQSKLLTRTVHSEILWMLNPGHNIAEAIKRFGVNENTTSLLLVHICAEAVATTADVLPAKGLSDWLEQKVKTKMEKAVDGDLVPLDLIHTNTDLSLVKKYYKLNGEPAIIKLKSQDQVEAERVINEIVVSAVAMKSVS